MCPQAPIAEVTGEPSLRRVLRCERIAAGPRAALIRVTLTREGTDPQDAAGAQLIVVDRGETVRCQPLPSPPHAGSESLTIGFAVARTATPLGLVLGEHSIALADTDTWRDLEHELEDTRARLKEARNAYASIAVARREAVRAAARAEVAAHDATARADELARRIEHDVRRRRWRSGSRRGAAAPGGTEASPVDRGPRARRRGTLAVLAAGGAIPVALLVAMLGWPAGRTAADHGVGAVSARASAVPAGASAVAPRSLPKLAVDPLALRLQIPARYLALYRQAAKRYGLDWTRLAAIGAIESRHGQAQIAGVVTGTNADGASGPAQFLAGTWERFGLDGDADGTRNPHDPADAIPAMASYLRASGAPKDWRAALRSYNHSDAYVDAVEKLAASLRSSAS